MTYRTTSEPRTILCKTCKAPILKIGSAGGARVLQASIVGWDLNEGRLRMIIRCAHCKRRLRLPTDAVIY